MSKQIQVTRVFNAPLEMVWQLWVNPEMVKRWWGPKHFTSPVAKMDFREGGKSLVSMLAPAEWGGVEHFSIWEYIKIIPMETIEFIQNLATPEGIKISPVEVGMPADFPTDIKTVVLFKQLETNKIEMTVTEYADMGATSHFAQIGLEQCFDKMLAIFEESL